MNGVPGITECKIGYTGPGGGLVFYNAEAAQSWGQYLEMAPKTWSGGNQDPTAIWCSKYKRSLRPGSFGTAIGKGDENTVRMDTGCTSGAGQQAADYTAGGKSDWFLPSKDELNAMYSYRNSIVDRAKYGFASFTAYWSSSQDGMFTAWTQGFSSGKAIPSGRRVSLFVRPVRAF